MTNIKMMLEDAQKAAKALALADTETRNNALNAIASALRTNSDEIIRQNAKDVKSAIAAGKSEAIVDRLMLDESRVEAMAKAVEAICSLPDPLGELHDMVNRPNGLRVGRMRVPLGVIGIIFESRPNVICDAGCLCLKSGNATILRGGSEASNSNAILGDIISKALHKSGLPAASVQVLRDSDRKLVQELLQARGKLDLLIPRGGEGLIKFVDENARVPIILHYKGVCHVYVDEHANQDQASQIIVNAKTQRPGVCNAAETLLVHSKIAEEFLPMAASALIEKGVEIRGCEKCKLLLENIKLADEDDWDKEYLDLILSVKIVDDLDSAMQHIAKHGSGHTEVIVTENYSAAGKFVKAVDASCVMVNASTRFNDGGELGLGAEIGISTTKLHAYGPMGLKELTTNKFVVFGMGQVRG